MAGHRIFASAFAGVYPHYVQKAEKKNRTKADVDQIICWLTGYDLAGPQRQLDQRTTFEQFFAEAPALHPNRSLITGVVCGVRVESVEDPSAVVSNPPRNATPSVFHQRHVGRVLRSSTSHMQHSGSCTIEIAGGRHPPEAVPFSFSNEQVELLRGYLREAERLERSILANGGFPVSRSLSATVRISIGDELLNSETALIAWLYAAEYHRDETKMIALLKDKRPPPEQLARPIIPTSSAVAVSRQPLRSPFCWIPRDGSSMKQSASWEVRHLHSFPKHVSGCALSALFRFEETAPLAAPSL